MHFQREKEESNHTKQCMEQVSKAEEAQEENPAVN